MMHNLGLLLLMLLCGFEICAGQATAPPPQQAQQSAMFGSVPSGTPGGTLDLTLSNAIDRALSYNLALIEGAENVTAVRAARLTALAELLPSVTAQVGDTSQQVNLKAFGFSGFPGIRTIVGPFSVFDARGFVSWPLYSYSSRRLFDAARSELAAANLSQERLRSVVANVTTVLYLEAIANAARIDAARAELDTARAIRQQAEAMREAGAVAGIEVVRARVEEQARRQRVIFARNEFAKSKIRLARAIGMPLAQDFKIAGQIAYQPLPELSLDEALKRAYAARPDYRGYQALVEAAESRVKAARGERLPSFQVDANYGAIGPHPSDSHGTYSAAVGVSIPIFEGGRIEADRLRAGAAASQRRAEYEDLRGRIDQEVRTALLDARAAAEQVEVARSGLSLAEQQLSLSRDRFAAGVTTGVEVSQSQQAVAAARENYIASLDAFNTAKAALVAAMGLAPAEMKQFLGLK